MTVRCSQSSILEVSCWQLIDKAAPCEEASPPLAQKSFWHVPFLMRFDIHGVWSNFLHGLPVELSAVQCMQWLYCCVRVPDLPAQRVKGVKGSGSARLHVHVHMAAMHILSRVIGRTKGTQLYSSRQSIFTRSIDQFRPTATVQLGTWTDKLKRWRSQGQDDTEEVRGTYIAF